MVSGPTIGRRIRHFGRYREIAQVLAANGFGWFIDEVGLAEILDYPRRWFRSSSVRQSVSTAERVRRTMEQLGPTFVKLGQVASVRRDVFPPDFIEELSKLQDEVEAIPLQTVRAILERELECPVDEIFRELVEVPVGSASIGQVHKAVLLTGEQVAVKIQRPDIERQIRVDLDILMDLARMAERHFEWARLYALTEMVEEFRITLLKELDYITEGRNADKLREIHSDMETVHIPQIHWELSTGRVLVMEFVDGIKLTQRANLIAAGHDASDVAGNVANALLSELLLHGFFHADPHPGNLAVLPSGDIAMMDFGMVGKLPPEIQRHLASLVISLMRRDSDGILRTLHRMDVIPLGADEVRIKRDIDMLRDKYYDIAFHEISISEATADLFSIAYKHKIRIPSDLILVGKALMTLEGVIEHLNPEFRILDVAEPFGRRILKERFNPKALSQQSLKSALDAVDLLIDLPRQLRAALQTLQRGRVQLDLDVNQSDRIVRQLSRISNRWSVSILLLSLSIFLAGLMVASAMAKSPETLWALPVNDIALGIGGFLVLAIVWSIIRSGRS